MIDESWCCSNVPFGTLEQMSGSKEGKDDKAEMPAAIFGNAQKKEGRSWRFVMRIVEMDWWFAH